MFIYNLKLDSKNIVKIAFIIMSIIITIFFIISIYKILSESFKVKDEISVPNVAHIEADNYTNILKSVYEDLDTYIGQTICFTGYVHRNSDFDKDKFVLARDMQTSHANETLIVGFLCSCSNAESFEDGSWVEVTAKISKGNYHGEIPVLQVLKITKASKPDNPIVCPPDGTYVPTSVIY